MEGLRYILLVYLIIFTSYVAFAGSNLNTSVKIDAGHFNMGCSIDDTDCNSHEEKKGGTVIYIDTFYIQIHEVSVEKYTACVKTTKYITPYAYQRNKYCNYNALGRNITQEATPEKTIKLKI